jgi:hypothetical protein
MQVVIPVEKIPGRLNGDDGGGEGVASRFFT